MFGVSPAFVLSGWGEGFLPRDYSAALEIIAHLGYQGFQLEVFSEESLGTWLPRGAAEVASRSRDLGLRATQLVAHFLLPCFSTVDIMRSDWGTEAMKRAAEVLEPFPECRLISLPLGAFRIGGSDGAGRPGYYTDLWGWCRDRMSEILDVVVSAGCSLALEILPFSLIGGSFGFLTLAREIGSLKLGYNFDTGHAWACKEELSLIPLRLGARIFGTHLCDNHGHENFSLRPGTGSIAWQPLLRNLLSTGYKGSLDVEIRCPTEVLNQEYSAALSFLKPLLS